VEANEEPFAKDALVKIRKKEQSYEDPHLQRVDVFRNPLVSVNKLNRKKLKNNKLIRSENNNNDEDDNVNKKLQCRPSTTSGKLSYTDMNDETKVQDFTFKDVEHVGFEDNTYNDAMCFGCWSSGLKRKCSMHESTDTKIKTSETMILCRNWELDIMRRRYRAEEIQEIFLQKESSLRFDVKRKRFFTVVENKHPIYRFISFVLDNFNSRMVIFEKVKKWLKSFVEEVRTGKLENNYKYEEAQQLIRLRRSLLFSLKVDRFTRANREFLLQILPITGF
jgi:hypothetical protein